MCLSLPVTEENGAFFELGVTVLSCLRPGRALAQCAAYMIPSSPKGLSPISKTKGGTERPGGLVRSKWPARESGGSNSGPLLCSAAWHTAELGKCPPTGGHVPSQDVPSEPTITRGLVTGKKFPSLGLQTLQNLGALWPLL